MNELILNYVHPVTGLWVEVGSANTDNGQGESWEELAQRDAELTPSIIFFLTKEVVTTDVDGDDAVHPTN